MSNFLNNIRAVVTVLASQRGCSFNSNRKGKNKIKRRLSLDVTLLVFLSLCSHMLPDRLSKGEEVSSGENTISSRFRQVFSPELSPSPQIFFFCFNFLKHIVSEKFSAVKKQRWVCLLVWCETLSSMFLPSSSSLWFCFPLRRKNSNLKDSDFTVEDLCQLSKFPPLQVCCKGNHVIDGWIDRWIGR